MIISYLYIRQKFQSHQRVVLSCLREYGPVSDLGRKAYDPTFTASGLLEKIVKSAWIVLALLPFPAAGVQDAPPHLDARGLAAYQTYQAAESPRAFAIAPGGAHAWVAGVASEDAAEDQALESCRTHTEQTCVLYSVNGRKVFDARRWPTLWASPPRLAGVGIKRGMRFPDLALLDPKARPLRLSDLNGGVTVLHFWGSWCPHCRKEMPGFARLAAALESPRIRFLAIPVREDIRAARTWLSQAKLQLPQYDGGAGSGSLRLAGGGTLADREIARAFPATYVLGARGEVLFSRLGPVQDWDEYADFLKHAARSVTAKHNP